MKPASLLAGVLLMLFAHAVLAQADEDRILVTFDDPGMSNAARAGPVRPGYARRSGSYLVSVEVRRAARRIEAAFGVRLVDEWPIDPLKVHCIVYAVNPGTDIGELLARLRDEPRVESAQRMNTFEVLAAGPDRQRDPYAALQHNMDRLELSAAHRWSRGRGSRVAIIDTGADTRHPELKLDEWVDFVDEDDAHFDDDAHGTAVAGIIGASADNGIGIVGVAPAASISVLRACWYVDRQSAAICDSFTLAKALSFAIDSGARVINLSLSGPRDSLLERLAGYALDSGNIIVTAAADESGDASFPGAVDGVIVAGAIGSTDPDGDAATVFAPGIDILVPVPGGGFDYASGNSLSAAHVSGIAALLVARQPSLTTADVFRLLASGSVVPGGSVNACRSLSLLLDEPGCRPAALSAADDIR